MTLPTVVVAHERSAVRQVVARVLAQEGFAPTTAADSAEVLALLADRPWDALVLDVALPGIPAYELCERARAGTGADRGVRAVVLVASVYRATSYKRRPTRLYGADDYVEVHHLGDALPNKLRRLLGLELAPPDLHVDAGEALRIEGDERMSEHGEAELAKLIVADVVLYNGDRILGAPDVATAAQALAGDLEVARELLQHVTRARRGPSQAPGDPIGVAFAELMRALGRAEARP